MNHFQDACLADGHQEGKWEYQEVLIVGRFNLEDEDLDADYSDDMNCVVELFATMVFASLFRLGFLGS